MDHSLVYGLVTAGTTMAGGMWIASRPRKWLTAARLAGMMALGAGLLLAVLCFELLPESIHHGGSGVYATIFAGLMSVLLFERYLAPRLNFFTPKPEAHTHGHGECHGHDHDHVHAKVHVQSHVQSQVLGSEAHDHHSAPLALLGHGAACSALGCLLVCTFFDGVAMAAGFTVNASVGLMIAIGLICHMLPEGLLASAVVLASGNSAKLARRAAIATGVAFLLGMLVPTVIGGAAGSLALALPFATGVLLYVVLGQLMPVALKTATGVPLVVAGALIFGLVERLLPHTH